MSWTYWRTKGCVDIQEIDPDINKVIEDVNILLDQFDPAWRSKYGPVKVSLVRHAL